ncbi:MAG: ribonuclease R [Clostridia bacterium]|nr:ribonuclease R [Clostridia bacterium]
MKYKHEILKNKRDKKFTGTVQGSDKGYAFIIPDDESYGHDFFVPRHSVNGAFHGDRVLAAHVCGTQDEAYVLRVLARGSEVVIGTFERDRSRAYVYPDNPKQPEIFVPLSLSLGARNGEKVVCKITSYPKNKAPGGEIIEVLGESGELEAEEISIIRAYNLEEEFPDSALKEAREVAEEKITLGGREDFRNKLIITIDGEDTRDIDDGVSLERKGKNFVLGVHIADVSHYVKTGTALDNDAYGRGTSVYFPDRVLPMLPKELSNGACSLNEGEDRYAMSCIMTFTPEGERLDYKICKSVICSRHRTTYTEITALLNGEKFACDKYPDLVEVASDMQSLCLAMEKRRERLGSVNLDVKEAHIYVNDEGEIVIPPAERTISQCIIEQFMISANEAVAEFLESKGAPCLYRIHEQPAPEKANTFFSFLRDLGVKVKYGGDDLEPIVFQQILKSIEDKPFYSVVNKVMLRSMQKARYSEENLGHFGLASKCYCHFTSPIRRYPDLFVHRALKAVLEGKKFDKLANFAHDAGVDCSARERVADECERKVDDLYKLYFMAERLGEEYDAVISGVTAFGIFAELDNTVEGFIPLEDLPKDSYKFYEEKFTLAGAKFTFKLGGKVKVKVADCDLGRMRVLFKLIV